VYTVNKGIWRDENTNVGQITGSGQFGRTGHVGLYECERFAVRAYLLSSLESHHSSHH
jgi:hypothetical protein